MSPQTEPSHRYGLYRSVRNVDGGTWQQDMPHLTAVSSSAPTPYSAPKPVLLRPDGVVAWAGEVAPNYDEAAQAASRWFGEPDGA